ncbi:hypothetical protein [Paenibacillus chitinolyticus]
MQTANYRTRISRDKLTKAQYDPDTSVWENIKQVREAPEQYFQPAIELLDSIKRRSRAM